MCRDGAGGSPRTPAWTPGGSLCLPHAQAQAGRRSVSHMAGRPSPHRGGVLPRRVPLPIQGRVCGPKGSRPAVVREAPHAFLPHPTSRPAAITAYLPPRIQICHTPDLPTLHTISRHLPASLPPPPHSFPPLPSPAPPSGASPLSRTVPLNPSPPSVVPPSPIVSSPTAAAATPRVYPSPEIPPAPPLPPAARTRCPPTQHRGHYTVASTLVPGWNPAMYGAPFDACGAVRDLVSSSLVSQNTGRRSPGFCFIRSDSSARPGRIGPRPGRTGSTQARYTAACVRRPHARKTTARSRAAGDSDSVRRLTRGRCRFCARHRSMRTGRRLPRGVRVAAVPRLRSVVHACMCVCMCGGGAV